VLADCAAPLTIKQRIKQMSTWGAGDLKYDAVETLAFQIKALKLPAPVREYRFYPKRGWRADFAWPNEKLLVEYEGGIFARSMGKGQDYGWHQSVGRMLGDMEKYNKAAMMGFRVLRFTANHVKSGEAVNLIEQALKGGIHIPMQKELAPAVEDLGIRSCGMGA